MPNTDVMPSWWWDPRITIDFFPLSASQSENEKKINKFSTSIRKYLQRHEANILHHDVLACYAWSNQRLQWDRYRLLLLLSLIVNYCEKVVQRKIYLWFCSTVAEEVPRGLEDDLVTVSGSLPACPVESCFNLTDTCIKGAVSS